MHIAITIVDDLPTNWLPLGDILVKGNRYIKVELDGVEKVIRGFYSQYSFTNLDILTKIYQCTKGAEGLVQAIKKPWFSHTSYHVKLYPIGFPEMPVNESEFKEAIWYLLTGLCVLHGAGFVHRDIR